VQDLVLMPLFRATKATDMPGMRQAATSWALDSGL
jgi:hypothetical protein